MNPALKAWLMVVLFAGVALWLLAGSLYVRSVLSEAPVEAGQSLLGVFILAGFGAPLVLSSAAMLWRARAKP